MKRIENNKGITLIALVVTIIVLIILAGISISALTNENGIIKEAKDAKASHEKARIQEEFELASVQALKENINTSEDLSSYLQSKFSGISKINKTDTYVRFDYKGQEIVADVNGKITFIDKIYTVVACGANVPSGYINFINCVVENDTLIVPNYYKGGAEYKLTKIVNKSLYELYNSNIIAKKIIVSEGIEKIGTASTTGTQGSTNVGIFGGNIGAEEIYLPNTLLEIGDYAFTGNNIKSIIIPKSVKKVGYNIFNRCNNLTTIYCEASSKPAEWNDQWNGSNVKDKDIIWGYNQ